MSSRYLRQVFGTEAIDLLVKSDGDLSNRLLKTWSHSLAKLKQHGKDVFNSDDEFEGFSMFKSIIDKDNKSNEDLRNAADYIIKMALKYNLSEHSDSL